MQRPTFSGAWARRDFLRIGTGAALGLAAVDRWHTRAGAAHAIPRPADKCIIVWLTGGPATIDMWDPKPLAPAHIRGDFATIDTAVPGLSISEHLPRIARVLDRCAVVRSVSHTLADHAPGTELVATGRPPSPALVYPTLGAVAARLLPPPESAAFLSLGENVPDGAGFLGAAHGPLEIAAADLSGPRRGQVPIELPERFTPDDLARRDALRQRLDARFAALDRVALAAELSALERQAVDILLSNKVRQALDLSAEPPAARQAYGGNWAGQALLAARRLIESGVRVVTVAISGWDTHANNFGQLRTTLLPQLDPALAALIADLDQRRLLDHTIVYCAGEFGRTPRINAQAGRDHWPRAMSVLLAGGPLARGAVLGATDAQAMEPVTGACSPAEVNATLLAALGVPTEANLVTPSGRPIPVMGGAAPLAALLPA